MPDPSSPASIGTGPVTLPQPAQPSQAPQPIPTIATTSVYLGPPTAPSFAGPGENFLTTPSKPKEPPKPTIPLLPNFKPKLNDEIMFVAMNNEPGKHMSSDEAKAMVASRKDKNRKIKIKLIETAKEQDTYRKRDASGVMRTYDLTQKEGCVAFVESLGLKNPDQNNLLVDLLCKKQAPFFGTPHFHARDEIAAIMDTWAIAEKGGAIPSRLIISGHHVGYGVWGDNNGSLEWEMWQMLAEAMPNAARCVEDLFIAGCYSGGGQEDVDKYTKIFPNLKTILAYNGSSPGSASGAITHELLWEEATLGRSESVTKKLFWNPKKNDRDNDTRKDPDPRYLVRKTRKGNNVWIWTKSKGNEDRDELALWQRKEQMKQFEADYKAALKGETDIPDPQNGPVRSFYTALQKLIRHQALPHDEKFGLYRLRDQAIRLLYYKAIRVKFAKTYAKDIERNYKLLNLTPPKFEKLSRKELNDELTRFTDAKNNAPANISEQVHEFWLDLDALVDLDPQLIPETWL